MWGEWRTLRDMARQSGCTRQKSRELLMRVRNAFENIGEDIDVLILTPKKININGAHISSKTAKENLSYHQVCELTRQSDPNDEILGSIIAATPRKVCKGIFIPPTKNLLEGYARAA